jgi:hypothetical protein
MSRSFQILIFFLLISNILLGQKTQKVDIYGFVSDSVSKQGVAYSTIQLKDIETGKTIFGLIADSTGKFFIQNVVCQSYQLIVSSMGYKPYKALQLIPGKGNSFYLRVKIVPDTKLLEEVEIAGVSEGSRTLIDKTVFVPDSLSRKNSVTGLDLISKVPGVTVNKATDQVKILGNSNVLILVDGSNSDRDLKTIDPDDIEKVEVITNPSSKYDSDVATVLNVILKEERKRGLKVIANLNYFTQNKHNNGSVQVDYVFSKFRLFGSCNLNASRISTLNYSSERQTTVKEIMYRNIDSSGNEYENKFRGYRFRFGFDYNISKKTLLNFTGSYGTFRSISNQSMKSCYLADNTAIYTADINRNSDGTNNLQNYTVFAKHEFGPNEHTLSWNTNFYIMNRDAGLWQKTIFMYSYDTANTIRNTHSLNEINSVNSKLDYSRPIGINMKAETGVQFYHRFIENSNTINQQNDFFDYKDTRLALYGSLIYKYQKFSTQLGIRAERFSINIYDSVKFGRWNYMPAFTAMFDLGKGGTLKLIFKEFLTYPNYYALTPFLYYSNDSLTASSGNPYLKPEKLNNLEFNYSLKRKSSFVSASLYYKRTNHIIGSRTSLDENNILSEKMDNITFVNQYGGLIYLQTLILKFVQFEAYFECLYDNFEAKAYNGFELRTSVSVEFPMPWDMYLNIDMSAEGTTRYYNGYEYQSPLLDEITLGKSFLKDKAEINISLINFFMPDKWHEKCWDQNYTELSDGKSDSRCILFRLTYFLKKGREPKDTKRELNMENDEK